MLELKIKDLGYNGKYLGDFGFIVAKTIDNTLGLDRSVITGEINTVKNIPNHYGVKYKELLPLKYLIVKNPCEYHSQKEQRITNEDLRNITRWLTSPKTPKCFTIDASDYAIREYYGVFTDIKPYEYDSLYGIEITFQCNAPYGFDKNVQRVTCDNSKNITINNPTDELCEYIYPTIKIIPNNCTSFSIQNHSDNNNIMSFNFESNFSEIIIDCNYQRIVADGELLNLNEVGWDIYETTDYNNIKTGIFNLYWLRFIPMANKLSITGNGQFTIEYKTPVKVGGYY